MLSQLLQVIADYNYSTVFKHILLTAFTNFLLSGIGCKNYKAGPTQCTKLRVYRPKTCGVIPPILDKSYPQRPFTSYLTKEKMGAMDLAIGWDYRPKGN